MNIYETPYEDFGRLTYEMWRACRLAVINDRRNETMKLKSESYPDKIRRIARDLSRMRNQYDVNQSIEKLQIVANELERNLKKPPLNKT